VSGLDAADLARRHAHLFGDRGAYQTADVGAELTEVGDWIGESFTWPERA
jgi:hypothetical protein